MLHFDIVHVIITNHCLAKIRKNCDAGHGVELFINRAAAGYGISHNVNPDSLITKASLIHNLTPSTIHLEIL